jgi:hypothetical protein
MTSKPLVTGRTILRFSRVEAGLEARLLLDLERDKRLLLFPVEVSRRTLSTPVASAGEKSSIIISHEYTVAPPSYVK